MWRNWSGGQRCEPVAVEHPSSPEEIAAALRRAEAAGRKVRVAGTGHSFSKLVPTEDHLLVLDRMQRLRHVDRNTGQITVEAGLPLYKLNALLAEQGLALPNLGDVDVQTVAGALSTGTHGTGARLPNLSAQVEALEWVCAEGSVVRSSTHDADPSLLRAARISLGSLGVLSAVTLRCVEAFTLKALQAPMSLDDVLERLDALVDENDHFEFFVFPYTRVAMTKRNNRTDETAAPPLRLSHWTQTVLMENHLFGAVCGTGRVFPHLVPTLNRLVTRFASQSQSVDQSFRIFVTPRRVRFEEIEYAVPRAAGASAVREALEVIERGRYPANFPLEVRFVAPDDAYLSPSFERPSCYIAVHVSRGLPWEPCFRAVEEVFKAHGGRPHWGKRHFQTARELKSSFPAWSHFQAVRHSLDPHGLFTTPAMEELLGRSS